MKQGTFVSPDTAAGWVVTVTNPSNGDSKDMTITAMTKKITAKEARQLAEAAYKKHNLLPASHCVMAGKAVMCQVGDAVDAPKCSTPGCKWTAHKDGQCGKCFRLSKEMADA